MNYQTHQHHLTNDSLLSIVAMAVRGSAECEFTDETQPLWDDKDTPRTRRVTISLDLCELHGKDIHYHLEIPRRMSIVEKEYYRELTEKASRHDNCENHPILRFVRKMIEKWNVNT